MATHCSILAWRIPLTEESLVGYSPWGHKESATTERLSLTHSLTMGSLGVYLQLQLQATMLQKTSIHFRYLPISLTQRFSKCSSWKFLIYLCSQNDYCNTKKITFLLRCHLYWRCTSNSSYGIMILTNNPHWGIQMLLFLLNSLWD